MRPGTGRSATFGREEKLSLASLIVIVGFLSSVVFHYWQGAYEGLRYPHDTYLYRPSDSLHYLEPAGTRRHAFGDLLAVCVHARERAPYHAALPAPDGSWRPFASNYAPLGAMIAWPLTLVPYRWAIGLFLTGSVAGLLAFGWSFFRIGKPALDAIHVTALCLMAYPVHVVLDRGNLEIVVFGMLAAAVAALVRRRGGPAAGWFGAAIAMKIFPATFLPLVWRRFGVRGVVTTSLVAGGLGLASLVAMAPPLAESARQMVASIFGFSSRMDEGLNTAMLSSGLYAPVAVLRWYADANPGLKPVAGALGSIYPVVALALFAGATWLTVAGRLRLWEAVTLATLAMVALPKAAPDYRLLHLLVPFALFVHSRSSRASGIAVTTLFALLWVPKAWLWIAPEVSVGAVVNPACMAALAAVVVVGVLGRGASRRVGPAPAARFGG